MKLNYINLFKREYIDLCPLAKLYDFCRISNNKVSFGLKNKKLSEKL